MLTVLYTGLRTNRGKSSAALFRKAGKSTALRDKLLGAAILTVITLLFLWLTFLVGKSLLPLTADAENMRRFVVKNGVRGRLMFFGIQILQGFLPVPIELTTIAGGYAFGPLQGTLLTLVAMVVSTTAIFYITKLWGQKLMNLFFTPAQQKKVFYFRDAKVRKAITWIVYLVPGLPKRLFTFSAGLIHQDFGGFLLITILARAPTIVACTFGGHALEQQDYRLAIAIFSVVGTLCLVGFTVYRFCTGHRRSSSKTAVF